MTISDARSGVLGVLRESFLCIALILLAACGSTLAPEDRVQLRLVASPTTLAFGDTVHLLGIAHNPTRTEIHPTSGCAPGIGFYVRDESGNEVSLYDGLSAFFTCQRRDSQHITAGETDSVRWEWVPDVPGVYEVRAALVFDSPRSPSDPASITVR